MDRIASHTMRRRGLVVRRVLLALALLGCHKAGVRVEQVVYTDYRELTFDRPSDLIPPEKLRVTSVEDRQVGLAWEPVLVGDVGGYAILRSRDASGTHLPVGRTRSRFDTVYIDQGEGPERLGDGQTYSYRVHPFDSRGRVSRSHAHITTTTEARPDPPQGLRVFSNQPRKVPLAWEPNESRSVVGYAIYRSPTPSGEWSRIGFAEGRLNTVWEDPVNGDLRVMYYRIEALNRFNSASDPTPPERAVTKGEPLPPVGLEIENVALGRVELRWQANVEPDIERYEIWRSEALPAPPGALGPERKVAEVPAGDLRFTDSAVGCGQDLRYRLRAVDGDRLVSGFSDPLMTQAASMGLLLAEDPLGAPELRWDPELQSTWPGARISEARGALPDRLLATVPETARYSLAGLEAGPHTLRVTLLPGDPQERESPTCELRVDLPPAPARAP